MAFRLPRLRSEGDITTGNKPTLLFMQWWQSVVKQIEDSITSLTTVTDALSGVEGSITGLQAHDNILDGLVDLSTGTGIVEKTGAASFGTRRTGTDTSTSLLRVVDGDGRYLAQGGTVSASAATTTHKLQVSIGGSVYYILLSNV